MAKPIAFTQNLVLNGGVDEEVSQTELDDNKWVKGKNVEPLPDGFRRRLGHINMNGVPLGSPDVSVESGTNGRTFTGAVEQIAQGFKIGTTAEILAVEVRLKSDSGTPTATTELDIRADATGPAGSAITNLTTTDFSSIAAGDLTSEYKWYRFTIADYANVVTLTAGTQYYLSVKHANVSTPDTAIIEEDTAGNPYADGSVWTKPFPGGAWSQVSAADLNFRIITYAGPAWVTGIKDFSLSDAATEYHMVFAGKYLYKLTGSTPTATLTPVNNTLAASEFTASQDTFPSMVVGNDRLLVVNGTDTPSKKFYKYSGTEYWENEGIDVPTATLTPSDSGTADPPDAATYEFDYYYWNDDLGIGSNRRYDGITGLSHVANGTNDVLLSGFPTAVVRSGDRATHIRIEVKKVGTDSLFRLCKEITIGTTTYSFIKADYTARTTEGEYDDDVPPQHTGKIIVENRQFLGGNTASPWRIYFSKIANAVPYYEAFPPNNFRDFGRGDGDYWTAFAFMPPRILIVGFKNSIWAIDARNPATSDRQKIATGIGVANHKSIVSIGGAIYFVSDADKHKGLFKWEGGLREPEHLAGMDNTFQNTQFSRLDNSVVEHYAPDDNRHQIWFALSGAASSENSIILVYDYRLGAWTKYDIHANMLGSVEASNVTNIYIGQEGYEGKTDTGTLDYPSPEGVLASPGNAIPWELQTKHFNFGTSGDTKLLRHLEYIAERKSGSNAVLTRVISDFGASTSASVNLDYPILGAAFVLGTDVLGGTAVLGGSTSGTFISERRNIRATGKYLSLELSGNTDFNFKSLAMGVQGSGRKR